MTENYLFSPCQNARLYKPVSDWLEMLPLDSTGLNIKNNLQRNSCFKSSWHDVIFSGSNFSLPTTVNKSFKSSNRRAIYGRQVYYSG